MAAQNAVGVPETKGPLDGLSAMERFRRGVVRAWTDNRVDLAELQNEARRTLGRPLTGEEMVLESSRFNPSGAAKVAIDEHIRPILTGLDSEKPAVTITGSDGKTATLTETQVLSRMMELVTNRDVASILKNPDRRFPGGLTGAESEQAARALFEKLPEEAQVRVGQAANQVRDLIDLYRERLVDAGVWSRELADTLKEKYPTWVPTRILDYMSEAQNPSAASIKSISLNDRHLRQYTLEGTEKMREDGIASLIRYVQQAEQDIARNRTFNAFYNLRQNVPGWPDLIHEVSPSTTLEKAGGLQPVSGWVDGEKRRFAVPPPLAAAIRMEGASSIPIVSAVTRAFRELVTRTPFFVAGQVPLDAMSYLVRETAREGGPSALPRVAAALMGGYREAFRGLLDGTFHGNTADYLRSGGGMAGYYQRSAQAASTALDDVSRRSMLQIRNRDDLNKTLKWILTGEPIQVVGQRVELAPRTASYNLGLRRGISQARSDAEASSALVRAGEAPSTATVPGQPVPTSGAGLDTRKAKLTAMTGARDVTLDFQRGGNLAMTLNQVVPFSNVGIQSSVTPWRSFRENPGPYAATVVGLIGGPMLAAEAWNRADPQRARDYEDVPDYIKDRGIVVMTGQDWTDDQGNRHPYYALVPTRELSPFVIFARELAGRALGAAGFSKTDEPRTWQSLLEGAISAASPVQANSAADLFSSATPYGLSTGVQLASNRDFFRNRDIATERNDQQAGVAAQAISAGLNKAGLQSRPSQVEFTLRDMTGNVGASFLAGADLGAELLGAVPQGTKPQSLQATPIVGSVARRFEGSAIGGRLERARDARLSPRVAGIMGEAGLRDDQLTPVSNTVQGVPLNVSQQAYYQQRTNQYMEQEVVKARRSPGWANPKQREQLVRDAMDAAKERASSDVLRIIPPAERQQAIRRAG